MKNRITTLESVQAQSKIKGRISNEKTTSLTYIKFNTVWFNGRV